MPEWISMFGPSLFWLAALVALLAVEAISVGLVSIWFAAGALAAFLVSMPIKNIWVQIVVFLFVSTLCLLAVRPLVRKYFIPKPEATNADRVVGAEAVVTEEVDNLNAHGQVQVRGTFWTARSEINEIIPVGATVRVARIEGVKVIVAPLSPVARGVKKKEE